MPGKRVQFDDGTWHALDLLSRDSMKTFQELADEPFADLLKRHGRPTDLKTALKQSLPERAAMTERCSAAVARKHLIICGGKAHDRRGITRYGNTPPHIHTRHICADIPHIRTAGIYSCSVAAAAG